MILKQSTAYTRAFKMIDSTDHLSKKTGLTCTVNISKAGAAFGAAGGTVTEVANGWYKVALTTTDTATLGDLAFYITATGADDTDFVDTVAANILGDTLPASVAGAVGSVTGNVGGNVVGSVASVTAGVTVTTNNDKTGYTVSTVSDKTGYSLSGTQTFNVTGNITGNLSGTVGSVTGAVGSVTGAVGSVTGNVGGNVVGSVASVTASVTIAAGQLFIKKNTALANFEFPLVLSSDHVTLATGLTVAGQVSIDGGAFTNLTNAVSELSSGVYKVNLAAADVNGTVIMLKFTSATADTRLILFTTQA